MKKKRDKEESDAAMTIGYAILQCEHDKIASIIEKILDLTKNKEIRAELFLIMHRREISVPARFAQESGEVIAAFNERADRQRASMAAARDERQAYAEFKRVRQARDTQPRLPTEDKS